MHIDHLTRMANQIGHFFEAMPDRAEARLGAVRHIRSFWEPRMRRELLAHVDTQGGAGLSPFMAEAITAHREVLEGARTPV